MLQIEHKKRSQTPVANPLPLLPFGPDGVDGAYAV